MKVLVSTVLFLVLGTGTTLTQNGYDLFQQALVKERVHGDLEEAIQLYQRIVETHANQRELAAKALLQMGQCYEKLGKQQARKIYQQVLEEYSDQPKVLVLAREGLSRLTVEPTPLPPTMTVREFMRSGEQRQGEVSGPTNDRFFDVSSDGQIFVYTDWGTGDLAIKNVATGEVRALYGIDWGSTKEFFENPVLSPDDKKVAYVRYPNRAGLTTRIDVDSIEGGNRETVYDSNDSGNLGSHDWSRDGENILISIQAADGSVFLATVSLKDKKMQRLVTLNWEGPQRAQYSPDGQFIAYDSTKGGDRKIYLISADGAQERILVDSPGEDDSPLWTRDGRFLLFRSNRSGKWDLYALGIKNGQPTGHEVLIKSNLGSATFLRGVTTKGQLFYHETASGPGIVLMERTNKTAKNAQFRSLPKILATENKRSNFAPDGKRLVYLSRSPQSKSRKVRITNLEGKILKEIPLEPQFGSVGYPIFSPDAKKIVFRVYDAKREAKIMVLSAETGTLLKLFSPLEQKGHFFPLGWSQDSRLLYVFLVKSEAGERFLAAIDVETEKVMESTLLSQNVRRAKLSPDGNYLVMLSSTDPPPGRERKTQLVLRSLKDGSEKLLKEGQIGHQIVWDFDSRHLFYRKVKDEKRLYRFSIETGEEAIFLADLKGLNLSAVSPDGKYLAFQNNQSDIRIWVLENFLPESKEQIASR
ncbi:tetratricopeptide repeat protein [Acidobacteria bacterium AH-259-G07]|nr:tetratricopeptide repeat protein [Acidobacteria bacterium AH-259-G07]